MKLLNGKTAPVGSPDLSNEVYAFIRAACSTLTRTSPDVVSVMSLSLRVGEWSGEPEEWQKSAAKLAVEYSLCVEFSVHDDRLNVRMSRLPTGESSSQ